MRTHPRAATLWLDLCRARPPRTLSAAWFGIGSALPCWPPSEIAGWVGTVVLIASFGGVSYGRIDGRSRAYQTLNIVGGLLLAVNTAWHRAWPSVAMNIIWIGIAVGALAAGLVPRRASSEEA